MMFQELDHADHFVFYHSRYWKWWKKKKCNKGRESACLAAEQCVGPSDATCSVSACMVLRPQKKSQVVLGHRFSPPYEKGANDVRSPLIPLELDKRSCLCSAKKNIAVLGLVHWFKLHETKIRMGKRKLYGSDRELLLPQKRGWPDLKAVVGF